MKNTAIILSVLILLGCYDLSYKKGLQNHDLTTINNSKSLKSSSFDNLESLSLNRIDSFKTWMNNDYREIEFTNPIFNKGLLDSMSNIADTIINYKYKSRELITNKYNNKSYQRPRITIVKFTERKEYENAINLLLDCFPNDCKKIEMGIPVGKKITPSIYLLNDLEIIAAEIDCENENLNWVKLKDELKKLKGKNSIVINATCGAIEWYK